MSAAWYRAIARMALQALRTIVMMLLAVVTCRVIRYLYCLVPP